MKRAFDLVVATLGLICLLPLFFVIAAAIRLDSPGPVFFRQERVGLHGRRFRIFKFRTMVAEQADGAPQITAAGDCRVTRVGAVLRRWKLDELPQLIDVLRGTMSLVGPRPEVPRFVEKYPEEWRDKLLSVQPGITDFASVRYADEGDLLSAAVDPEKEYVEVILPVKLRYSLNYVDRRSIGTDMKILGLTLKTIIAPHGAAARHIVSMKNSPFWFWLDRRMSAIGPRNRTVATLVDALVVLICWHAAYLFRLGFERWQPGRPWYDDFVSFGVVVVYLVAMALIGVPRGLWRFFGFDDFNSIVGACFVAGLLCAVVVLMAQLVEVARAVLVLHPIFCIFSRGMLRMTYRVLWEHARASTSGEHYEQRRAIILGAGDSGRRVVGALHRRDGWAILALLDDDRAKWGLRIDGVAVEGGIADLVLPHVLTGATHIIVAMSEAPEELRQQALELAKQTGLVVMSVPVPVSETLVAETAVVV